MRKADMSKSGKCGISIHVVREPLRTTVTAINASIEMSVWE